jgi:hypothetical protein
MCTHTYRVRQSIVEKNVVFFQCLLETYVRPEKYWSVCVGLLANHLFDINFIFLSDSLMVATERATVLPVLFHSDGWT